MPFTENNFLALVEAGYESRSVEFRTGFSWVKPEDEFHRIRLIKTILGLSNTRGGGYIILGVEDISGKPLDLVGCDKELAQSFVFDDVKSAVDNYADQGINFDLHLVESRGRTYIIIRVVEFDEFPVICRGTKTVQKTDGKQSQMLRRGTVYVRQSKGEPATIEVTEIEMREIIEMAVDKQQAKLKRRGWKMDVTPSDDDLFKKLRSDF